MEAMTFSIEVGRTPEEVFALISDIERHGQWSPQEFEVERLADGPTGVGTRYRTNGRKGARRGVLRENEVVITEFEPPTRFGFAATEKAGTYRTTFVITSVTGGSRIERIVEPPDRGATAFVRHRLLAPVVRRYVQQNMDALKTRLERSG